MQIRSMRSRQRSGRFALDHGRLIDVLLGMRSVARRMRRLPTVARRYASNTAGGIGTFEAVPPSVDHAQQLNKFSAVITQRKMQGAGQAQLFATDVGKVKNGMDK